MSIAAGMQRALRSFRSLIGFDMRRVVFIKDLKDLAVGPARFSIDIKDLKDLKMVNRDQEVSPTGNARGGQAPALRVAKIPPPSS